MDTNLKTAVATLPVRHSAQSVDVFADPTSFEHAQRVAKVFSGSSLVPKHFQGNVADCLIAYQIARRLNEEPLTVMQNVYIVNGRPGWMTSYVIARANRAGVFKSRITWSTEGKGDGLSVTASTVLADSGEVVSVTCDMAMARGEQWIKNAKYQSMPEHMLRWRSAAMLIRLFAPEVMLGLPVVEELETMPPPIKDVTPVSEKMKRTLDDFAAGAKAAEPSEENSAQEPGPASPAAGQGAPDKPSETSHSEASGAPAADQDKNPTATPKGTSAKAAVSAGPATEQAYVAHANAWIEEIEDADELEQRWTGEKTVRNKANVTLETREQLQAKVVAKASKLRGSA